MLQRMRTRFSRERAMEAVNILMFPAAFSGRRLIWRLTLCGCPGCYGPS